MKVGRSRGNASLQLKALALSLFTTALLSAASAQTFLGAAGNYAILELNTATAGTHFTASLVTVNGSVGVSHLSSLTNMAPSIINGTVYYQDGGSVTGPGHFNGTPATVQQNMTQAVTDAMTANQQDALLTANQTISGNVTTSQTFSAVGALTVVDIGGDINLNNNNITLSGNANDIFVINVGGNLSLVGTASLSLSGGVTAEHVLYNFTGGSTSSHGSFNTHVGDVVNGTMLAPFYDMNLDGTWNGELIGGPNSISLLSGAIVNQHSMVPEPATYLSLALGIGAFLRRRKKSS